MEFSEFISSEEPDWSRETPNRYWDPSKRLIRSIRRYQATQGALFDLRRRWWVLEHRFWSVVTGADIPLNVQIGGGLILPHPNGVVIHPGSKIGVNCLIFQQVTITNDVVIGGHVDIGAGAKLLGPLIVGSHVRIGANSVVTSDIPRNVTAAGIPAKPLP